MAYYSTSRDPQGRLCAIRHKKPKSKPKKPTETPTPTTPSSLSQAYTHVIHEPVWHDPLPEALVERARKSTNPGLDQQAPKISYKDHLQEYAEPDLNPFPSLRYEEGEASYSTGNLYETNSGETVHVRSATPRQSSASRETYRGTENLKKVGVRSVTPRERIRSKETHRGAENLEKVRIRSMTPTENRGTEEGLQEVLVRTVTPRDTGETQNVEKVRVRTATPGESRE
ncbi:hypothetical protein P154DRAFT_571450 [Amniculicola lignicola CBS 123094]|uniref:Uncharacterized protein n=1 Tax=Amniculicola lignicola CBS 123094 TaxID=1392246 RepID=A0A6A5WWX3_9PLEO|nr:hypothetical protein P154DRAFT_571450 [Amniculicola lignicola CBS 123094]